MLQRIGSFEILQELGRGGMGVVYLARDTRLDREVAIKALPEELGADPVRLERFEREARTLAQLTHPNLAGIHGVEEQDGARYLILEFVEGESLADRLDRGPVPVDEAIEIAAQIASGLEAAHDAGVVHRDLKPANIMVTPEGRAKILDFGLARYDENQSSSGGLDSPTLTSPHPHRSPTIEGTILGTAAYMSPEQARGRRIDKRSDIWSFGVVLYEMLVGASPFVGETASDSIGAVLHKQFDFTLLPPHTPTNVRRVLSRCLQRDKEQRFRDIGDIRIELLSSINDADQTPASVSRRSHPLMIALIALLLCAVTVSGIAMMRRGTDLSPPTVVTADLLLDIPDEYRLDFWAFPRISADGTRVVLVANSDGRRYLIVRDLADRTSRVLQNTDYSFEPNISPDGRWVSFQQDGMLKRVAVAGGPAIQICDPKPIRGTLWRNNAEIVIGMQFGPLHFVDVESGEMRPLYDLDAERFSDRHPALLPDGTGAVFTRVPGDGAILEDATIWGYRFDQDEPVQLLRNAAHPFVLSSGQLLFMRSGTLMAVGFDAEQMRVTSPEIPLMSDLRDPDASGPRLYDISSTGTMVYFDLSDGPASHETNALQRMSMDGTVDDLIEDRGSYSRIALSEDESMVAVYVQPFQVGQDQIRVLELNRKLMRDVTGNIKGGELSWPVWHPSGKFLYFGKRTGDDAGLYRARTDGLTQPDRLQTSSQLRDAVYPWDISPDATRILVTDDWTTFYECPIDEQGSIIGEPELLFKQDSITFNLRYSPDGKWLAFLVRIPKTGPELFVTSLENPGDVITQISVGGATGVEWDQTQQRLLYFNLRGGVEKSYWVNYEVTPEGDFRVDEPELALELQGVVGYSGALSKDAQNIFVVRQPERAEAERMVPRIFVNWSESVADQLP